MNLSLNAMKPMPSPAGEIINDPDLASVFDQMMNSSSTTTIDVGASAGTVTIPANANTTTYIPENKQGPISSSNTTQTYSTPSNTLPESERFKNFSINEADERAAAASSSSSDGFVPLELNISDIEARVDLTPQQKEEKIQDRKEKLELQNYILKQKHEENLKFKKEHEKTGGVWLDKIVPPSATESQKREFEDGLRKLLAATAMNVNDNQGRQNVAHVVEATASVLVALSEENTRRASDLERAFQERDAEKQRTAQLEKELQGYRGQQQQLQHQTSLVSPVKTINTAAPNQDLKQKFAQLDDVGKMVFEGYVRQNIANKDPIRDLQLALADQEARKRLPKLGDNPTFSQLYSPEAFNKRPRYN